MDHRCLEAQRPSPRARSHAESDPERQQPTEHRRTTLANSLRGARRHLVATGDLGRDQSRHADDDRSHVRRVERLEPVDARDAIAPTKLLEATQRGVCLG